MKKAVIGVVIVAVVGFRPVARRVAHGMLEHCGQMAEQCKQMAAKVGGRGEAVGRS